MPNDLILLVDVEPSIIQLSQMYLEREGYRVESVKNGEAALSAVERLHPALVVLDVMLPKLDGFEVCRRLRASQTDTAILMLTGEAPGLGPLFCVFGVFYRENLRIEPGADDMKRRGFTGGAIALSLAACAVVASVEVSSAADPNASFELYCISCHGPDARGIENLGVDLVASDFVARSSTEALIEFLKVGRLPDDPDSRTGRPMPGFSWVSESELAEVAAFLKSPGGK